MGYDVHITREDDGCESEDNPISLDEWIEYVVGDPEMRRDDVAKIELEGKQTLSYVSPGLSVWTTYSKNKSGGNQAWFDYRHGAIVVKNPDDEILEKMKQIAAALNANVIGDEGELY